MELKHRKTILKNMFFDSKSFASKFDLVVLKHTLEHIKYPKEFLGDVFNVVADDGFLYIEVPSLDVCMDNFLDDFNYIFFCPYNY